MRNRQFQLIQRPIFVNIWVTLVKKEGSFNQKVEYGLSPKASSASHSLFFPAKAFPSGAQYLSSQEVELITSSSGYFPFAPSDPFYTLLCLVLYPRSWPVWTLHRAPCSLASCCVLCLRGQGAPTENWRVGEEQGWSVKSPDSLPVVSPNVTVPGRQPFPYSSFCLLFPAISPWPHSFKLKGI